MKIEFNEALQSGNAVIDAQHKALVDTVNNLAEAIEKHAGLDVANNTVRFLIEYTMFHFAGEEKFMQEHNYPEFEAHKKLHDEFTMQVNKLYSDFMMGGRNNVPLMERVQKEASDWLVNHIMGTDLAMIDWVNKNA